MNIKLLINALLVLAAHVSYGQGFEPTRLSGLPTIGPAWDGDKVLAEYQALDPNITRVLTKRLDVEREYRLAVNTLEAVNEHPYLTSLVFNALFLAEATGAYEGYKSSVPVDAQAVSKISHFCQQNYSSAINQIACASQNARSMTVQMDSSEANCRTVTETFRNVLKTMVLADGARVYTRNLNAFLQMKSTGVGHVASVVTITDKSNAQLTFFIDSSNLPLVFHPYGEVTERFYELNPQNAAIPAK